MSRFAFIAFGTLFLLSACGDGTEEPTTSPDCAGIPMAEYEMEVGTGLSTFTAASTSTTVKIIAGPQGGHHIWTAIRMRNAPPTVRLRLRAESSAGAQLGPESEVEVELGDIQTEGYREKTGLFTFVDREKVTESLLTLRISASGCEDGSGESQATIAVE